MVLGGKQIKTGPVNNREWGAERAGENHEFTDGSGIENGAGGLYISATQPTDTLPNRGSVHR